MLAFHFRGADALRALLAGSALLAISACSSGGSAGTSPVPNFGFCGNDTQYALANPGSGSSISTGSQSIEIVANGNNNQINQSYQNFQLVLVPQNSNGGGVTTAPLTLSQDPQGYHPFGSDYYYRAQLQTNLQQGLTYNVYLNAFSSNCTPVGPIGQLNTF